MGDAWWLIALIAAVAAALGFGLGTRRQHGPGAPPSTGTTILILQKGNNGIQANVIHKKLYVRRGSPGAHDEGLVLWRIKDERKIIQPGRKIEVRFFERQREQKVDIEAPVQLIDADVNKWIVGVVNANASGGKYEYQVLLTGNGPDEVLEDPELMIEI